MELDLQEPCQAPGRAFLVGQEVTIALAFVSFIRGFRKEAFFTKGLYKGALYELPKGAL